MLSVLSSFNSVLPKFTLQVPPTNPSLGITATKILKDAFCNTRLTCKNLTHDAWISAGRKVKSLQVHIIGCAMVLLACLNHAHCNFMIMINLIPCCLDYCRS